MTDAPQKRRVAPRDADPWRDPRLPIAERVADLVGRMTLEERVHQLASFWAAPSGSGEAVAPLQDDFADSAPAFGEIVENGVGQLTRAFGTAPVSPGAGRERLAALQSQVGRGNRFGIPAMVHEECLTGVMAHGATVFPCPLAWGASFDPELVTEMASAIAATMRRLGAHQGLAPVLDVTRDYRWGRTEETIGEDPHLVATLGTAYVRGLENSGVVATLKHFGGYAASRAGRNLAPVSMGPREFADIVLEPFVAALREGGARAVMHSYADVDGLPSAADERLLTGLLREELGFAGIVVADYFGISFLETLHGVAGSPDEAAILALRAGVDVELPAIRCYGAPLADMVRAGDVPEERVDRSVARVLAVKCQLGLLDEEFSEDLDGEPERDTVGASTAAPVDPDPPEHRGLARRLAEESVVLLDNDGILPLGSHIHRLALVGPLADDPRGMLGCYSFPRHVGDQHPDSALPTPGVEVPTLADAVAAELPGTAVSVLRGCGVDDDRIGGAPTGSDIAAAVDAAARADVCVLALGDRSGMFGRGTSGEGCDAETLALPGRQAELAAAILATDTPMVLVVISGRPYALGGLDDGADRAGAVVQAFFPGEEGGPAIAGVLSGRVEPSGRLPVSVPRSPGGQPGTYLHARLGGRSDVSSVDPTPLYPFGHGRSWTSFSYADLSVTLAGTETEHAASPGPTAGSVPTDGSVDIGVTVRNEGDRAGTEVVQLYLTDPVASVVRPERTLAGWARVRLEPGGAARVAFTVHADRTSFTGRELQRVVEPGLIRVAVGSSSADLRVEGAFTLDGPERVLGPDRVLNTPVTVRPLGR